MKCYRRFRLAPNLLSPQKHINSHKKGLFKVNMVTTPIKCNYMYLHKKWMQWFIGNFRILAELSFVSAVWQLFLTRTRYKNLINFVLAYPRNLIILYAQFSNSFHLMTGKEMETKVKRLFFSVFFFWFCFVVSL